MSKLIAAAGIRGASAFVAKAKEKLESALAQHGPGKEVGFPNTGYYLPVIYSMLGHPVAKLGDMTPVIERCERLLPALVRERVHLPYLGPALDAGMAALFAMEMIEAIRYLEHPDFYVPGEEVAPGNIWLGAADDIILRKRGVEFVDGTAPGFAAILGAAPSPSMAAAIAEELQRKNLYVFMAGSTNGKTFSEQLVEAGVQIGWGTRLVSFGPETSAAVFAFGFATRAAMSFGGLEPGDFRKILIYNKDRIFAFALTLGMVTEEWYGTGLAAVNFGFPIIADTPIPQILPTGVCTHEHVVSNVPHKEMV
ncbi:MAG: CO dehydrogenase/CO-methylating acetyl-CoA synthase complex subunit beta, partial [Deltaproteobacteria bacterium]|nr:CO dehydrogenase/CO-methylating acetyl-CoA synthase complex subunit beta [Deltaproteobacteria bacterium]